MNTDYVMKNYFKIEKGTNKESCKLQYPIAKNAFIENRVLDILRRNAYKL